VGILLAAAGLAALFTTSKAPALRGVRDKV